MATQRLLKYYPASELTFADCATVGTMHVAAELLAVLKARYSTCNKILVMLVVPDLHQKLF